jgi:hypothetical protein
MFSVIKITLDTYEPIVMNVDCIVSGSLHECVDFMKHINNAITYTKNKRIEICKNYISEKGLYYFHEIYRANNTWDHSAQVNGIVNQLLYNGYISKYPDLDKILPPRHQYELNTTLSIVEIK